MLRGLEKYRQVYPHLWKTYGSSWLVRLSFMIHLVTRIAKFIVLPVATSLIIARLAAQDFPAAYQAVMLFVSASLMIGILTPLTKYVGMRGENTVYHQATSAYFSRLINVDLDYFHSNLAGYLTTATRQYVDSGVQLVRALRDRYATTLLSIIFPLIVMLWLDPWLGLITLALSIIQAGYLIWASHAITPLRTQSRELYKRNSGRMADVIANILAVRSNAQEKTYTRQVQQGAIQEAETFRRRYALQAKLVAIRECITVTFFMVLLWLTVERISSGQIDIGAAVLVTTYVMMIMTGIYSLADDLDEHDDFIDKLIPAFDILDRQNAIVDPTHPQKLGKIRGEIQFRDLSFAYENGQSVLHNFSLHIPAGQKVGIVGVSGAGKSTLTKLLLRFNDIESGEILLDGIDIRQIKQADLRRAMAYVPQEPLLFHHIH